MVLAVGVLIGVKDRLSILINFLSPSNLLIKSPNLVYGARNVILQGKNVCPPSVIGLPESIESILTSQVSAISDIFAKKELESDESACMLKYPIISSCIFFISLSVRFIFLISSILFLIRFAFFIFTL